MVVVGAEQGLPSLNGWTFDVIGAHLYVGSLDGIYRLQLNALPDPAAPAPERVGAELVAASGYRAGSAPGFACCNGGAHALIFVGSLSGHRP